MSTMHWMRLDEDQGKRKMKPVFKCQKLHFLEIATRGWFQISIIQMSIPVDFHIKMPTFTAETNESDI